MGHAWGQQRCCVRKNSAERTAGGFSVLEAPCFAEVLADLRRPLASYDIDPAAARDRPPLETAGQHVNLWRVANLRATRPIFRSRCIADVGLQFPVRSTVARLLRRVAKRTPPLACWNVPQRPAFAVRLDAIIWSTASTK